MKKPTKAASTKKGGGIIRVAMIQNPATKKTVYVRVTKDGRLGKHDADHLHVKKIAAWVEVEAGSWKQATAAVRAGKGRKVRAGQGKEGRVPFAKAA